MTTREVLVSTEDEREGIVLARRFEPTPEDRLWVCAVLEDLDRAL